MTDLPWYYNPAWLARTDASHPFVVTDRLWALFSKAGGWHPDAGPSPTSGQRTALHDYITLQGSGILTDLECDFGIDFPDSMHKAAELVDFTDNPSWASHLRLAATDGEVIA